jgi:hypothetical protein
VLLLFWVRLDVRFPSKPVAQILERLEPEPLIAGRLGQAPDFFFELRDLSVQIRAPGAAAVLCARKAPSVVLFDSGLRLVLARSEVDFRLG